MYKPAPTPGDTEWFVHDRFGMFIHWGLYSTLGRHEWVMENEGIPAKEYEQYANNFKPKPNFAQAWARLAKRAAVSISTPRGRLYSPRSRSARSRTSKWSPRWPRSSIPASRRR